MPKTAPDSCEDLAYTRQFFTVTRKGHTSPTAEFGSPSLVWHVAFWPRNTKDPHAFSMVGKDGKIKDDCTVRTDFKFACDEVTKDFNEFLKNLQLRGRVPAAPIEPTPFKLDAPRDWEAPNSPFDVLNSEATGFTLWWPDSSPKAGNVMANGTFPRPDAAHLLEIKLGKLPFAQVAEEIEGLLEEVEEAAPGHQSLSGLQKLKGGGGYAPWSGKRSYGRAGHQRRLSETR
jgi:hypothetical protein